ncbi:MAG: hypothetical protein KDK37_12095 [Leptospiraceae bacterium]|nr:hypothetical protein [Leptospiraceae bacterium]MCB1305017.1 hypothetical protein [Leptospiraceae bacterium]
MASIALKGLRRIVALLLIGAQLGCSSFRAFQTLEGPKVNRLEPTTRKIRILPVAFKNSAQMDKLNFISNTQFAEVIDRSKASPDPFLTDPAPENQTPTQSVKSAGKSRKKSTTSNNERPARESSEPNSADSDSPFLPPPSESDTATHNSATEDSEGKTKPSVPDSVTLADGPEAPAMDGGEILKEVLITNLQQTNRFEILSSASFSTTGTADLPQKDEMRQKGVDYLLFAEITDFEVRKDVEYWKVPLWALLLIAALFIKDDDTRSFALHTLVRLFLYLPRNSKFWELGLGKEDLELRVSASVNLRLVDPYTGSVVYSDQQSLDRLESVDNLDLIVWRSENSLQIKESTAGRQLRFLTANMVNDLLERLSPPGSSAEDASEGSDADSATPATSPQ